MQIVLATRSFQSPWGSETYLLTVAEALERLGHQTTIVAEQLGKMADFARSRGLRVEDSFDAVEDCDAAMAQDGVMAYRVAERFAEAPRLFVAHSADIIVQAPPQLEGVCELAVAMNDRVASHLRGMANPIEVLRLHQPIDMGRFRAPNAEPPRSGSRALAFGKNNDPGRQQLFAAACERAGLELRVIGDSSGWETTLTPERELGPARVVIGTGRCALEGMAAGRAVYVYGITGGDGWITPESYPAMEADGFAGMGTDAEIDEQRLAQDLAQYREDMGPRNRDLAYAHHDSMKHARALVEAWRRGGATFRAPTAAEELARLARIQRQTEETVALFASETLFWRQQHQGLRDSRSYRIGSALLKPLDALRRLFQRRRGDADPDPHPAEQRELPTAEEWLREHSPERLDTYSAATRPSEADRRRAGSPHR